LIDGTSTVTFLPYLGQFFIKEYIIANYIGEAFSALIPGLLGLIQGIGKDTGCFNDTIQVNGTVEYELKPAPLNPSFSVTVYFLIISGLIFLSTVAFTIIHYTKFVKKYHKIAGSNEELTKKDDEEFKDKLKIFANNKRITPERGEKVLLLAIIFIVAFLFYGFLPGLN
jgi:hypothetical protein